MCKDKTREECEFKDDIKGCALKHISKARELISRGEIEAAEQELRHVEEHLKEM